MIWTAALIAMFVWWFATGIILLAVRSADRKGGHAHLVAVVLALPVLAAGVLAVRWSLDMTTVQGVYLGFLGALGIWGWIELAFLTGVITGPMKAPNKPGLLPADGFARAFQTLAHHELLLVAGFLGLVVASGGAANRMALATYLVLFLARIGAKLNLYFGVPRINTEFIPARLSHLKSYLHQGPLTVAYPVTITVLTAMLVICVERLVTAGSGSVTVGFTLLSTLTALALIEHWLMVVPLPDAKLWRWMLPAPPQTTPKNEGKTHGL